MNGVGVAVGAPELEADVGVFDEREDVAGAGDVVVVQGGVGALLEPFHDAARVVVESGEGHL